MEKAAKTPTNFGSARATGDSRLNTSCHTKSSERIRQREFAAALAGNREPAKDLHRKLPVEEAAAYLGLSISCLNKWRVEGGGPPYLKLGRRVMYDVNDLEQWATQSRRRHTSEMAAPTGQAEDNDTGVKASCPKLEGHRRQL